MGEIEKRNRAADLYEPQQIEFFLNTHVHIDPSGLLPLMVKKGYGGPTEK